MGEFAPISSEDFDEIVPPERLDVESPSGYHTGQHGPPLSLRDSMVKYLEVPMRQGRCDTFFETGSRGAMEPVERDGSVALGRYHDSAEVILVASITLYTFRSFATVDSVARIRGWRGDIERALPALLVPHFRQVDKDVRYLLEGAPSDPGGPLAPCNDAEERFTNSASSKLSVPETKVSKSV